MSTPRSAALMVDGLTVRVAGATLLDGVSLSVAPGEVVGLVGPNGVGKTTLLDAVTGFVATAHGSIAVDGERVERLAPHERARRGLRRTFQDGELFEDLTVAEHLTLPAGVDARDVEEAIERAGLGAVAEERPGALDAGQRRAVALARALVGSPVVAILDEPAAGSGPAERGRLAHIVQQAADRGTAVLLCDHDQELVRSLSATVLHLEHGRLS